MASRKKPKDEASLPFAALQLLAPPVRVVSAALWKVMKQRDVMQYGVLEEFVTSACETVPGLLTVRHQGKLALGLRGRFILELCCPQPDAKVIEPHLKRICVPSTLSNSSASAMKRDVKIIKTVESFQALVQTLLTDPAANKQFFKEVFPVDYGPIFDQELEKLLWEFLIRLDQLLPVPTLSQTVSWLSDAPPVLEECARAATQPQLLKILLQHQTCLGHLVTAASLPPNMGDSILASLSLPPSGRAPSNQPRKSPVDQHAATHTRDKTQFIAPVIGLISNEEVPVMISTSKKQQRDEPASSKEAATGQLNQKENSNFAVIEKRSRDDGVNQGKEQVEQEERNTSKRSSGVKRKQPETRASASDEEEEVLRMSRATRKMLNRSGGDEELNGAALATQLHLPDDPSIHSIAVSCLNKQPTVIIQKLSVASESTSWTASGKKSVQQQSPRRKSPVKTPTTKRWSRRCQELDSEMSSLDDKENHPVLPALLTNSSSHHRSRTETSAPAGDGEDYVADSEDEGTKNFKERLFMKRYCKTKHGTYVPTLREYWKPGTAQRRLLSPRRKHR